MQWINWQIRHDDSAHPPFPSCSPWMFHSTDLDIFFPFVLTSTRLLICDFYLPWNSTPGLSGNEWICSSHLLFTLMRTTLPFRVHSKSIQGNTDLSSWTSNVGLHLNVLCKKASTASSQKGMLKTSLVTLNQTRRLVSSWCCIGSLPVLVNRKRNHKERKLASGNLLMPLDGQEEDRNAKLSTEEEKKVTTKFERTAAVWIFVMHCIFSTFSGSLCWSISLWRFLQILSNSLS